MPLRVLERDPEFRGRLGIRQLAGAWFGDHDEVNRWLNSGSNIAKYLADEPFDTVTFHRVPDPLARRDTQPGDGSRRWVFDYDQVRRVAPRSDPLQAQKFAPPPNTGAPRIGTRARHRATPAALAECLR